MSNSQNELNNPYYLSIVKPTVNDNFNIQYILYIPKEIQEGVTLAVEINSKQTDSIQEILEDGLNIVTRLQDCLSEFNCPILVPLIPGDNEKISFKKLSKDCFDLDKYDQCYRIDNQVLNIISKVKNDIKYITGKSIDDRIFMSGYYESGEFAQRFALLHPKVINSICINGGISTIPVLAKSLNYPLGAGGLKALIGKDMDIISYYKIKFRYFKYCSQKLNLLFDKEGFARYMHDIGCCDESIDKKTLDRYTIIYGKDMFERGNRIVEHLSRMGMDAKVDIFNLEHQDSMLIKETMNKYISDIYSEMNNEKGIKRIVL